MRRKIVFLVITIQFILVAFLAYQKITLTRIVEELKIDNNNKQKEFKNESQKVISLIKTEFIDRLATDNIKANNIVLNTSRGEQVGVSQIIENTHIFVYYFKGKGCLSCYNNELKNIQTYLVGDKKNNLVIISDFKNIMEQNIFERKYGIKTYDIGNADLGLLIEKHKEPFYFKLDKNLNVSMLYRPVNFLLERSKIYYDRVVE